MTSHPLKSSLRNFILAALAVSLFAQAPLPKALAKTTHNDTFSVEENDRLGLFIKQLEGHDLSETERLILEEDRLGIFIKQLEGRPLSAEESRILNDIDQVLEEQITQNPTADEKKLSRKERVLLAKIIGTVTFKGLTYNIKKLNPLRWVGVMKDKGVKDLSEKELTRSERNILKFFTSLVDRDALQPYLEHKLFVASKVPLVGEALQEDPEQIRVISEFATSNIHGLVKTRGLTKDTSHVRYETWKDKVARQKKALRKNTLPHFYNFGEGHVSEFTYLVDGPPSFAKREEIIRNARYNIDILVWAIQDDMTGKWIRDLLIQKHRQNVKVRLIVDGEVSKRPGYGSYVNELIAEGIEVIKWSHPQFPFVGQHRKMIIADGVEIVAGGLNFGDAYSHINPATDFWRDTDFYARGEFVKTIATAYFDAIWNEAAGRFGRNRITSRHFGEIGNTTQRSIHMELIDHSPEKANGADSHIYNSIITDIMKAERSIDIANAYVIVTDAFVDAVRRAVERGVRVRILTNSEDSVDEPTLANAMTASAKKLKAVGADIYLRKGTTLHSKFMVVDEYRSHIMSYNLHPRSERMEGEVSFVINDSIEGHRLKRIFEADIGNPNLARRVNSAKEIELKSGVLPWLLLRIMYDQL